MCNSFAIQADLYLAVVDSGEHVKKAGLHSTKMPTQRSWPLHHREPLAQVLNMAEICHWID